MRVGHRRARQLYAELAPSERFRVAVTALGHGDLDDWRHLMAAAPRVTVALIHPEIRERWEELRSLSWCFQRGASGPLAQLRMLEIFADSIRQAADDEPGAEARTEMVELAEVISSLFAATGITVALHLRAWSDSYIRIGLEHFGLGHATMRALIPEDILRALEEHQVPVEHDASDARSFGAIEAELVASMEQAEMIGTGEAS